MTSLFKAHHDYLELAAEANNVQLSCALTLSCKRTVRSTPSCH